MKIPVLAVLVATVAGLAVIVVGRNHRRPAAELPRPNDVADVALNGKRRVLIPVSDIMREEFGPGQHDPSEAIAGG